MQAFFDLTKIGIVIFVLLTGLAGYALAYDMYSPFDPVVPVLLLVGLYFLSAGSFTLNQAQEWEIDKEMPRTADRPIPKGILRPWQAYAIGIIFVVFGFLVLFLLRPMTAYLGLATVVMYNGFYTLYWKRKMVFGAVPGAIPGAMPVVIGFSVAQPNLFVPDMFYLFLIMFLWQMPHFWCLAIKYKEDYAKGGIPTLPVAIGVPKTLYHIGLYTIVYLGVALASPIFVQTKYTYFVLILPFSVMVAIEFLRYFRSDGQERWLAFFLWTNFSMLAFVIAPVVDKWIHL